MREYAVRSIVRRSGRTALATVRRSQTLTPTEPRHFFQ